MPVLVQIADSERTGPLRPLIELISADWFRPYYLMIKWPLMIIVLMLIAHACARDVESAERKKYRKEYVDKIIQLQERRTIHREYRNQDEKEYSDHSTQSRQRVDESVTDTQR